MNHLYSVASSVGGLLREPIKRWIGYLIDYDRNVGGLMNEIPILKDSHAAIQLLVKADHESGGGQILPDVMNWIERVGQNLQEADKILEDEQRANQKCCLFFYSDFKYRVHVSQQASEKTALLQRLNLEKPTSPFCLPPTPPPYSSIYSKDHEVHNSRKEAFNSIMKAFKEERGQIIGMYGMGGVGKTTLMKEIVKKAEKDELFQVIIKTTVSQSPNIGALQDSIAEKLNYKELKDNKDQEIRAGMLFNTLAKVSKFLIIFDDIWDKLDLEVVGIPHADKHTGCYILLTSRNKNTCEKMSAKTFVEIKYLTQKEAQDLFKEIVGDVFYSMPDAIEICEECAGLPLAIVTVASFLKGKDTQHDWQVALRKLQNPLSPVFGELNEAVYKSLLLSYNSLPKEDKYFFLLCCLFPEDFYIPIESLIRYEIGLRKLSDVHHKVTDTRAEAFTIVDDLCKRSLLLPGVGSIRRTIQIHDCVRDFGILVASMGEYNFLVATNFHSEKWKEKTGISLMGTLEDEVPATIDSANLEIFLWWKSRQGSRSPTNVLDTFQMGTTLRVLHFSRHYITSLSFICCSTNLRTLCLEDCNLHDVSQIADLSSLEILSFRGSFVKGVLPAKMRDLTRLRILDLTDCGIMRLPPTGFFENLVKMECLSIIGFGELTGKKCTLSPTEIKKMSSSLSILEAVFDGDFRYYFREVNFEKLESFKIRINKDSYEFYWKSSYNFY